ncbi:MAG: ATP-dependent Clp protease protease subunit [Myxococcota bacterium]|jgi:ATP-dependent Clp protease protease subunit
MSEKSWQDYVWEATKKTRTLLFSTDVSSRSVRETIDRLLALEADNAEKPITIILNTPGGSVSDGYALVDVIRFIQPEVRMIGTGVVASMGISLLISVAKENRLTLPNTRFMLHQPRFMGTVRGQVSDLEITATEMVKMKDKANQEVANATGQSVSKIEADTRRDLWLTAQEALEYGLVARIINNVSDL